MTFTVAACQMDSRDNKEENIEKMIQYVEQAASRGADIVAFPEGSTYMGPRDTYEEAAEPIPGPTTERFADVAQANDIYIHTGSFPETAAPEGKVHNTSTLIDPTGDILDTYRKIHMFDVTIGDEVVTEESAYKAPGEEIVTVDTNLATFGLSICYDLRFPELFSRLTADGATVLFVPAAFTRHTGKDHWKPLLRARAIENQSYVIAPGQIGDKPFSVQTHGKSLIIDPWGNVISQASDRETLIFADIDPAYTEKVRRELPSLTHKRPDVYQEKQPTQPPQMSSDDD